MPITTMTVDNDDEGAGALPLAPVDGASWYGDADRLDLPVLAPAPVPAIDQAALGEILADSLFGDVIELSDLIPHLLTPVAEPAVSADVPDAAAMAVAEAGNDGAGMVALPFNILFEEDGSSGHGTL